MNVSSCAGARRRLALATLIVAASCAPAIKRDISSVPPGQVGYDDLCGLQHYFDVLSVNQAGSQGSPQVSPEERPPALISAIELEGATRAARGGRGRFAFQTRFQLETLRRVLTENWKRLPDEVARAPRLDLEVQWAEKAGVRRVVTEVDAELIAGRESWRLPYHVCLSELLYGEELYRRRRETFAPPEPPRPDAGARDGAVD